MPRHRSRARCGAAVAAALDGRRPRGSVEVCTVPSTPARAAPARATRPVDAMLRALRHPTVAACCASRASARDQAGLGVEARRANAEGASRRARALVGRRFLLVDDVLTTGATLAEARRAVLAAGGSVAVARGARARPRCGDRDTWQELGKHSVTSHGRGDYGGRTGVVDPPFRSG